MFEIEAHTFADGPGKRDDRHASNFCPCCDFSWHLSEWGLPVGP